MEKTEKPTVAGILNIITGALGIIWAIAMFISGASGGWDIPGMEAIPASFLLGMAFSSLFVAVLALVGGINAVQRKRWEWALAGSIAAIFTLFILGIPAVILVAKSKNEFE